MRILERNSHFQTTSPNHFAQLILSSSNVHKLNHFGGIRAGTDPIGLAGIIGAAIGGPPIGPIGRIPGNSKNTLRQYVVTQIFYSKV